MQPDTSSDPRTGAGARVEGQTGQDDHHDGIAPAPLTAGPPPTVGQAEAAFLGALILNPEARAGIASLVGPDDFLRDGHRQVFVAIMGMHDTGQPVDVITLTDRLATTGQLDTVGGPLGVSDLCSMDVCPTPASWACYGTVVAREARRRRGIATLSRALDRLRSGEDPAVVASELAVAV